MSLKPLSPGTRRVVAWWLLATLWATTLLPPLAHALVPARGADWVEICTPQGMKRVPLAEAGPALSLLGPLDHCPLCLPQHDDALAPPPAPAGTLPMAGGNEPPAHRAATTHPPQAWGTAQPRGPPVTRG